MTAFTNNLTSTFPYPIGTFGEAGFFRPEDGYSSEAWQVRIIIFKANLRLLKPSSGIAPARMSSITYVPKTALGKKLVALRNAAIANGMSLMTAEEISEEIARRRGEIE